MTRAPIAAWRRLFAAGGAPAANYAVLARAPALEELLEPMAGVGLVEATSLDALTGPLEVSSVLARVLTATSVAEATTPLDADGSSWAPGPAGLLERMTGVAPGGAASRETDGSSRARGATPRSRPDENTAAPVRQTIGAARAQKASARKKDGAPADDGAGRPPQPSASRPAVIRQLARPRTDSLGERRGVAGPPLSAAAVHDANAGWWGPSMGAVARIGATTRVVFAAPHQDLVRLLARGRPTPSSAIDAANVERPSRPASGPTRADAARMLVRAVERVSNRSHPVSSTSALAAPPPLARTRTIEPLGTATRESLDAEPATDGLTSRGGFRGLALRTLSASDGQRTIPVRLEEEARVASEIPLDSLDSRVAESLARILEREARRYGIDVAGVRA